MSMHPGKPTDDEQDAAAEAFYAPVPLQDFIIIAGEIRKSADQWAAEAMGGGEYEAGRCQEAQQWAYYVGLIIGAAMNTTHAGGNQQPSGLRGDPGGLGASGDDTRDKEFKSLQDDYLRLTEAIRHLQEYTQHKDNCTANACECNYGWKVHHLSACRQFKALPCTCGLAGLLSLPRSSTAQQNDEKNEQTDTRVDGVPGSAHGDLPHRPTGDKSP